MLYQQIKTWFDGHGTEKFDTDQEQLDSVLSNSRAPSTVHHLVNVHQSSVTKLTEAKCGDHLSQGLDHPIPISVFRFRIEARSAQTSFCIKKAQTSSNKGSMVTPHDEDKLLVAWGSHANRLLFQTTEASRS